MITIFLTIDISFHELELVYQICVFSRHSEDLGVDGKIILKCIFKKWHEEAWTGLISVGTGAGGELL